MAWKKVVFNVGPYNTPYPWLEYSGYTFAYPDRPIANYYSQPHNQLIYLLPYELTGLTILNCFVNCELGELTISIIGGIQPYKYSYDNGTTLTDYTTDTTYIFTNLTGDTFVPYVEDSTGAFLTCDTVFCSSIEVTFIPIYLTSIATGDILDQDNIQHTTAFTVIGNKATFYDVLAEPTNNTSFVGWTYSSDATEKNYQSLPKITMNSLYSHQFKDTKITIYGLFYKDGPISEIFCYYPTESGYVVTYTDRDFFCSNCNVLVILYCAKSEGNIDIVNRTWYLNENLTINPLPGYYIPYSNTDTNCPPLYRITTDGVITEDGTCCSPCMPGTCLPIPTGTTTSTTTISQSTTTTTTLPITTTTTTINNFYRITIVRYTDETPVSNTCGQYIYEVYPSEYLSVYSAGPWSPSTSFQLYEDQIGNEWHPVNAYFWGVLYPNSIIGYTAYVPTSGIIQEWTECVATTTTTTLTPTTTTTTTIVYNYRADLYACGGGTCGSFISNIGITNSETLTIGYYYKIPSGQIIGITATSGSAGTSYTLYDANKYSTCNGACAS